MINLEPVITQIERLLTENSEASLTYAALECRLAIERICYERLRLAHDYISHDDLQKWQPSEIVKTLIQQVDAKAAETFTLSIAKEPMPEGVPPPTREDYEAMEWLPVGKQVGFNPKKLGKLWNALAKLALHIAIPTSKQETVKHYGDIDAIRKKVNQTLAEIRQISEGTMIMLPSLGEMVSFECHCGSKNKRKLELLEDGQIINCINPDCDESYGYVKSDMSFGRRTFEIVCQGCDTRHDIPKRMVEKLRTDQHIHFDCESCTEKIYLSWRPMQAQRAEPKGQA